MTRHSIEKFDSISHQLICPICHCPLIRQNTSFTCSQGHNFSIAAKGYTNFLPNQKSLLGYNHTFFSNRKLMMNSGLYDHVATGIAEGLAIYYSSDKNRHRNITLLDAGCGDGFYARILNEIQNYTVIGLDVSKEAIYVAASGGGNVMWLVGDVANIPLKKNSIDAVLNIFTPANYHEFMRILKSDGLLIKVIPGTNHMHELRHLLSKELPQENYSNNQVKKYFEKHFKIEKMLHTCKTLALQPAQATSLLHMTPIMFNRDDSLIDISKLTHITIDAEILIGTRL